MALSSPTVSQARIVSEVDDLAEVDAAPFVIDPDSTYPALNLGELWKDRHVLRHMVRRDLAVRYKETSVGIVWAVLQPLAMMGVISVFFGSMLAKGMQVEGNAPFHVTILLGLIVWQFVSETIQRSSDTLLGNAYIISKVYFCRLVFPLTPLLVNLTDFGIRSVLLALIMAWYGLIPGIGILMLPLLLGFMMLFTFAFSLWLSALTAIYRDIRLAVPFVIQVWMFLSPVFYQADAVVSPQWRWLYFLNPVAGIIGGLRSILFSDGQFPWIDLTISLSATVVLFFTGLSFFRRVERNLADIL